MALRSIFKPLKGNEKIAAQSQFTHTYDDADEAVRHLRANIKAYIKENGRTAPTSYSTVNYGLSFLGVTINQPYADNVDKIIDKHALSTTNFNSREAKVRNLFALLTDLLEEYKGKTSVRISNQIDATFEKILGVKAKDLTKDALLAMQVSAFDNYGIKEVAPVSESKKP